VTLTRDEQGKLGFDFGKTLTRNQFPNGQPFVVLSIAPVDDRALLP
jgi:hypothetical protein